MDFGFVILLSVLLDIGAQLNIWRTVVVWQGKKKNAQEGCQCCYTLVGELALSILVVIVGLAFNIGNIAGADLGLMLCLESM
jgi:Mn2+/Fe2+ NRAMP family transporter